MQRIHAEYRHASCRLPIPPAGRLDKKLSVQSPSDNVRGISNYEREVMHLY